MISFPKTLTRFILEQQASYPQASGEFSALMTLLGVVGKMIAKNLRHAGLIDVLGATGSTNVQGEDVKKLDDIANEIFIRAFRYSGLVCALASEEIEKPVNLPENSQQGNYLLLFDPLDGSSNTDVNMPLGSIFSVLRHQRGTNRPVDADFIRSGTEQVAAGYIIYGSSTMLVFTSGQGVHGFTLDPEVGEFLLSHENVKMPSKGKVYAVNEGNYQKWQPEIQQFVDSFKVNDQATGKPYSLRYSGCLAADVHRILLGGGVFLYPGETKKPDGKLRLLYEANPLAMVIEQAGGRATTGMQPILEVKPKALHQRVPLIIGSREEVIHFEQSMKSAAQA